MALEISSKTKPSSIIGARRGVAKELTLIFLFFEVIRFGYTLVLIVALVPIIPIRFLFFSLMILSTTGSITLITGMLEGTNFLTVS